MALERIAGICSSIVLMSVAAAGQQSGPAVIRHDLTHQVPDLNGRWQPTEIRSAEIRTTASSERLEEETIRHPDASGRMVVDEKSVTRRWEENGREQAVTEIYSRDAEGFYRDDGRLGLSRRVRITTTSTADGGRDTVEEVEGRSQVAASDPMRVVRRTLTTVRHVGADRWVTERQVFELDVNGRLVLVNREREESTGK
jgi:hypothetical protein